MKSVQYQKIEEIEFAIMIGEFRPRQRLVESELVERFKVGRTIIRECLRILEDRGVVVIHSNKGATVADFSAKDISNLYFLRSKLESMACQLAFSNFTPDHLRQMRSLQEKLKETTRTDRELVKIHEQFHDIIFKAANNEFLRQQVKRLISLTGPVRYFSYIQNERRQVTIAQHDEIIAALERGDKKAMVKLCMDHLYQSLQGHLNTFHPKEAKSLLDNYLKAMEQTQV